VDTQQQIERLQVLLGRIRERAVARPVARPVASTAGVLAASARATELEQPGEGAYEAPAPTQPSKPPPHVVAQVQHLDSAEPEDVFEPEPMEDLGDDFEPVSDELVVVDEALTSAETERTDESGELHVLDDGEEPIPESESRRRAAGEQAVSESGPAPDLEAPPESGRAPMATEPAIQELEGLAEDEIEVDFADDALVSSVEQTLPFGSDVAPVSAIGEEAELPTGSRASAATYDASLQSPPEAQSALQQHRDRARPRAAEVVGPQPKSPTLPVAEIVSGERQLPGERFIDVLDATLKL